MDESDGPAALGSETRLADNGHVRYAVAPTEGTHFVFLWLGGGMALSLALAAGCNAIVSSVDLALTMGVLGLGVGFGGMWRAIRKARRSAVIAEMERIAALPFAVRGYFATLAHEPSSSCQVRMHIELRHETELPGAEELACLLRRAGVKEIERTEHGIIVESSEIDCSQDDGPDTNRAVHTWQTNALGVLLTPLHAASGIAIVKMTRA